MNSKIIVPIILLLVVGVVGFFMYTSSKNTTKVGEGEVKTQTQETPLEVSTPPNGSSPTNNLEEDTKNNEDTNAVEAVEILNSGTTQYVAFTKELYEQALADGKTVFLQFYAIWCPTCIAEEPGLIQGIDQLNNPDIVALRVNYKDDETSEFEAELAEQFDVGYQHTKVVIKDGDVVFNEQQIWTADDVVENLGDL